MTKTDIITVNWNTGSLLTKTLQALSRLPENEKELIGTVYVIDNDSKRDSSFNDAKDAMQDAHDVNFEFIQTGENLGFSGGNNVGIRKIQEKENTPHVFLLNPDTEIKPGALKNMLAVFEAKPEVGIVGPKLLNVDGSLQGSVRPFPRLFDFILYMLKLGRVVQKGQENSHDYGKPSYVDQVMGAAFLIRNKCFAKIGELDERYFTLFEEVDYALTAKRAGWKTYYTPKAEVMHVQAVSFNQLVGFKRSWPWLVSSLKYARKNLGVVTWLIMLLLLPITLLLTVPASLKHLLVKHFNKKSL